MLSATDSVGVAQLILHWHWQFKFGPGRLRQQAAVTGLTGTVTTVTRDRRERHRDTVCIRRMVSDYFAEIINSKDYVFLVISFDYSDYFQIII